jgi:hypothetical protein
MHSVGLKIVSSLASILYHLIIWHSVLIRQEYIVKCRVVHVTKIAGSSSDDWIY